MSYRLNTGETLPLGIRRIAEEQIDDALSHLTEPMSDPDTAVHEARKCFKKVRGLLRLVRDEIGEEVYKRENRCFRDAGRELAEMRESAVMIKTLDAIAEQADGLIDEEAMAEAREALLIFYRTTRQRVLEEEKAPAAVAEVIQEARTRVRDWPVERDNFTAVRKGMRRVYKRGHRRLADAISQPSTTVFHEWRKRVKYLWYHTRILRPIWSKPMKALASELHDLSDHLGEDHDLAEFGQIVAERPLLIENSDIKEDVFFRIDSRRKELQSKAYRVGKRIYVEAPDAFIHRMAGYWQTWRS